MSIIRYSSNNSGGDWWLSDKDWYALEAAGWKVTWVKDDPARSSYIKSDGRWLGALATSAERSGLTENQAIAEWETITGERAYDQGCSCCGEPHSFYEVEDAA